MIEMRVSARIFMGDRSIGMKADKREIKTE